MCIRDSRATRTCGWPDLDIALTDSPDHSIGQQLPSEGPLDYVIAVRAPTGAEADVDGVGIGCLVLQSGRDRKGTAARDDQTQLHLGADRGLPLIHISEPTRLG